MFEWCVSCKVMVTYSQRYVVYVLTEIPTGCQYQQRDQQQSGVRSRKQNRPLHQYLVDLVLKVMQSRQNPSYQRASFLSLLSTEYHAISHGTLIVGKSISKKFKLSLILGNIKTLDITILFPWHKQPSIAFQEDENPNVYKIAYCLEFLLELLSFFFRYFASKPISPHWGLIGDDNVCLYSFLNMLGITY